MQLHAKACSTCQLVNRKRLNLQCAHGPLCVVFTATVTSRKWVLSLVGFVFNQNRNLQLGGFWPIYSLWSNQPLVLSCALTSLNYARFLNKRKRWTFKRRSMYRRKTTCIGRKTAVTAASLKRLQIISASSLVPTRSLWSWVLIRMSFPNLKERVPRLSNVRGDLSCHTLRKRQLYHMAALLFTELICWTANQELGQLFIYHIVSPINEFMIYTRKWGQPPRHSNSSELWG